MALIELRNVTKRYRKGDHEISPLVNASVNVDAGEFFVLLGPSGSGKTTLLNLIAGIDHADEGSISVDGQDLTALSQSALARFRAQTIGYVFQQHHLIPVLTAYENVELPLHLFSMTRADRHRRIAVALSAVGLADRADHSPKQLSGGQEQRVAIARAIVADPKIIVADEPTGNLDHDSAEGVLDLIERLRTEFGKTIVMVTHDPRAAARGTRVLRLDKVQFKEGAP